MHVVLHALTHCALTPNAISLPAEKGAAVRIPRALAFATVEEETIITMLISVVFELCLHACAHSCCVFCNMQSQHKVPMPIPKALRAKMGETILAEWKRRLAIAGPVASRSTWAIVQTFEWVESKFSSLLALVPDLIEPYEGCDEWGASMRRYAAHRPSLIALQRSTF